MKLHYAEYGQGNQVLLILHGLMGSERNWQRVAQVLAKDIRLIVPDMRNHGQSPHSEIHTIQAMREDVEELTEDLRLDKFYLLGHSMGGYAAMDWAFHHPEKLIALIIEDIAPRGYRTELPRILQAMAEIDFPSIKSKSEVDRILTHAIPRNTIRKFLLTNLHTSNNVLAWRVNVPALLHFVSQDISQNIFTANQRYNGPVLFIGGERSSYKLTDETVLIRSHFPSAKIEMVAKADHWVHYDAPEEFCTRVLNFIHDNPI
jgi:esterase